MEKIARSKQQNKYYWLVMEKITSHLSSSETYTKQELHKLFKTLYSLEEKPFDSTSELSKEEFQYYTEYVVKFAIEKFKMSYTDFDKEILL